MLSSENFESLSQFFSYLNEIYCKGEASALHVYTIIPSAELNINELKDMIGIRGSSCTIEKISERFYWMEISIRTRYEQGFLILDDDCWFLVSDGAIIKQVARTFLKNMFPVIKPIYLDSEELFSVADELQEKFDRIMFLDGTLVSQWKTLRNWEREPKDYSRDFLKNVEKEYKARWISLKLAGFIQDEPRMKCRIYNDGHLTLYLGEFTELYQIALKIAYLGTEKDRFFSNRERKSLEGEICLRPLIFESQDAFNMGNLGEMKKQLIRNYYATVIHSGNPVLLVQITDKQDGSSFDFYAYGNKIEVVPLSKASSASVTKVYSLISGILPTANFRG